MRSPDQTGAFLHLTAKRQSPISWVIETSLTPFFASADVELHFEVVAEEAREAVNDDDIERRGFAGARPDHALEFGPAVIGGRCAGLHIGLDKLVTAHSAVRFALTLLIGNGDIVLGLPRRGDAQVEGGAWRHVHDQLTPQRKSLHRAA